MRGVSRRNFVRGVGAAGLFAPFASLLHSGRAEAAVGSAKYLLIFHTTGTNIDLWHPAGSSTDEIVFSEMLEPLDPIKDSLVIIEDLDSKGTASNHGARGGLCGQNKHWGEGVHSLDQFVSDRLEQMGVATPFPNLILGGNSAESQTVFIRDADALSPIFLPDDAYNTIFGGVVGTDPDDVAAAALRLARRESILDLAMDQLDTLSGQLGSEERQKLELHADSIRELENRLTLEGSGSEFCAEQVAPGNDSEMLLNHAKMLDMATTALACDLTRVAAVQVGHHQATQIGLPEIGESDWHQLLHGNATKHPILINLERWLCGQFVAAAQRLQALPAPDGSGSLYDQTLMVWSRGMGDAVSHSGTNMRFVLAGATGYLDHTPNGRYLSGNGEAHQRVLFNCCEAMGITDFTSFGSTDDDVGAREPLSEIGS